MAGGSINLWLHLIIRLLHKTRSCLCWPALWLIVGGWSRILLYSAFLSQRTDNVSFWSFLAKEIYNKLEMRFSCRIYGCLGLSRAWVIWFVIEDTEIICWDVKYLLLDVNHHSCQLLRFLFLRFLPSLLKCVRRWTSLKQFYVTLNHLLCSRLLPYQVMPERLFQHAKHSIFWKGFCKRWFNREVCLLNFSSNI